MRTDLAARYEEINLERRHTVTGTAPGVGRPRSLEKFLGGRDAAILK